MRTAERSINGGVTPFSIWLDEGRELLRKGERTRLDLLQSASLFLGENSLEQLTVSVISKMTGVAHGTFYLHFKDRYDLVGALLGKFVEYLQIQMLAASRQAGDPVHTTTVAYFHLFKHHAGLMKCLVIGIDAFPQARLAFQKLNKDWADVVVHARLKGDGTDQVAREDLMRRAYALGGMVDQYLTALFVTEDPWLHEVSKDADAVINTLTDIWKRGIEV